MDKVIKYEKLQQELESVKAENYRIRCEKQSDLNKIAESEFNENQANDRLKEARAELAAEKAKAKELIEALEYYAYVFNWLYNKIEESDCEEIKFNPVLNKPVPKGLEFESGGKRARQAIAKYRQVEGKR